MQYAKRAHETERDLKAMNTARTSSASRRSELDLALVAYRVHCGEHADSSSQGKLSLTRQSGLGACAQRSL